MGWSSGDKVFEPVVNKLIEHYYPDDAMEEVVYTLIVALEERGWDTVDESIGLYDSPAVLAAANRLGYYADHQIPEDGTYSKDLIYCHGCRRGVRYRKTESGVFSEEHECRFSGKDMNGY